LKRFLNEECAEDSGVNCSTTGSHHVRLAHTVIMKQLKQLVGAGGVADEMCDNVVLPVGWV